MSSLLLLATVPSYDGFKLISTRCSMAFLATISTDESWIDPFLRSIFPYECYEIVIWLKIYTQNSEVSWCDICRSGRLIAEKKP